MSVATVGLKALFGEHSLGLGCMGLSGLFGRVAPEAARGTIHRALEVGIRHFDTAELYGPFVNEEIVADALRGRQEEIVVATKVGYRFEGKKRVGLDGRPESLRIAVEGCLRRLQRECIDLLYLHRQDPAVPFEDSIAALGRLVSEGKARGIGLSAVDADTVARASRVASIAVVQNEYSLLCRDADKGLLPTLEGAGIGFVAYSPLARGMLSAGARTAAYLPEGDYRRSDIRFDPEPFARVQRHMAQVKEIATGRQISVEVVAIAWLLNRGLVAIPGCRTSDQVETIFRATQIRLRPEEMQVLDALSTQGSAGWEN